MSKDYLAGIRTLNLAFDCFASVTATNANMFDLSEQVTY